MGGPRELTFLFFFFKALFLVHFVPCSAAPANAELVGEGGVMSASNNRDLVDEGLCLLLFQGFLWSVRKSPNFLPLSLNLTDFRGPKISGDTPPDSNSPLWEGKDALAPSAIPKICPSS